MSSNLRNKQFVFRNQQLSKEDYEKSIAEIEFERWSTISILREEFAGIIRDSLHKFANMIKAVNSFGENINNVKNVSYSFNVYDSEGAKYAARCFDLKDSYDIYGALGELVYEGTVTGWNTFKIAFFDFASGTNDSQYTDWCHDSSHLFACVGLKNKQYCILNKQYTKEEYEELVPKIIKHMNDMPYVDKKGRVYRYGEFFPTELSPFAYNETIAQEYFPLTKEEAERWGYGWKDSDTHGYKVTLKSSDLPDHIKEAEDAIVNEVIECVHNEACNEQCTQAFRIIPEELAFYRKMNLPLPRLCPNCRHYERLAQRNPLKFWHRKCQCAGTKSENGAYKNTVAHQHGAGHCSNEFETSYAPDRKEIVYCESCYNAEVV
jgi:hypothetical protein